MKTDPAELFDVVDEEDRVIGTATRAEVHARGLLHRAVHACILDSTGRVLLQLRSAAKDRFPNCWGTSVSGHVDSGETYDEAAHRELCEELGLPASCLPRLERIALERPAAETDCEFVAFYRGFHGGPFNPPQDEVSALEWLCPAEIDRRLSDSPDRFTPSFAYLWKRHRVALQPPSVQTKGS